MGLDNSNGLENCTLGMDLAEKHLKVPLSMNRNLIYSGVRVIATRILHGITIRATKLTLNAGLGTENRLLIEQYCY